MRVINRALALIAARRPEWTFAQKTWAGAAANASASRKESKATAIPRTELTPGTNRHECNAGSEG